MSGEGSGAESAPTGKHTRLHRARPGWDTRGPTTARTPAPWCAARSHPRVNPARRQGHGVGAPGRPLRIPVRHPALAHRGVQANAGVPRHDADRDAFLLVGLDERDERARRLLDHGDSLLGSPRSQRARTSTRSCRWRAPPRAGRRCAPRRRRRQPPPARRSARAAATHARLGRVNTNATRQR